MPFNNPPSNNPSTFSPSKFFQNILLGVPPTPANGPRPNLVTRVIKKLKQKIKKFAHFTLFNTGLQPSVQVVRFNTRRVYKKLSAFKFRKIAKFFYQHTGLQPVIHGKVQFQTRIRKTLAKASYKIRKLVRFSYWHTGQQPSVQVVKFQARVRKSLKKANFQLRKIARFDYWHVATPPNPLDIVKFHSRVRSKDKRKLRKNARFYPVYNTGLQQVVFILGFKGRRRIRSKSTYQYRKISHFAIWHFTPSVGPSNLREWVSPHVSHSRGDQ